jgi:hypothetical protein
MCACITLRPMGKRDDTKSRPTKEFDSARLAALTKEQLSEAEAQRISVAEVAAAEADDSISVGRTATLDDPMTTGLLAEVARRSQTSEFDDDVIKDVLDNISSGETNHPHTRRRSGSK